MLMYDNFKIGPAARICAKVGLEIRNLNDWSDFTASFGEFDRKRGWKLPDMFRDLPGGTGDTAVIQAILHAADYSHVADEMEGGTWSRLQYVTGDYAEAVAAAILRRQKWMV